MGPEPLSPEDSSNRLDLSQISSDQLTKLINQSAAVESNQSNRSQETGSQVSSPLTEPYGVSPQDPALVSTKAKRGRKPNQRSLKSDMKTKLERSRQSARECRARKKLRYQYLDDTLLEREKDNIKLKDELLVYQKWCHELDKGRIPDGLQEMLKEYSQEQKNTSRLNSFSSILIKTRCVMIRNATGNTE